MTEFNKIGIWRRGMHLYSKTGTILFAILWVVGACVIAEFSGKKRLVGHPDEPSKNNSATDATQKAPAAAKDEISPKQKQEAKQENAAAVKDAISLESLNGEKQLATEESMLWPPNHKMWALSIFSHSQADITGCKIVGISASEVDNEPNEDGLADYRITGNLTYELRAERLSAEGRTYRIEVGCEQQYSQTLQVVVPHSQASQSNQAGGKGKK